MAAGAFALLALVVLAARAPRTSVGVIAAVFVLSTSKVFSVSLGAQVGSFRVEVFDVMIVVFGAVGLARSRRISAAPGLLAAAIALTAMVTVATVSWVVATGLQAGVNQWRVWLLSVALLWWSLSALPVWRMRDLRGLIAAGGFAVLVLALTVARYGLGGATESAYFDGQYSLSGRPFAASAALVILVAAWLCLLDPDLSGPVRAMLVALLVAGVVLSQHRTVWVCLMASAVIGLVCYVVQNRHRLERLTVVVMSLLVCAGLTVAVVSASTLLTASATNDETFQWRLDAWERAMSIDRTAGDWVAGAVFGPTAATESLALSTHNMLFDTINSLGIVGVIVLVWLLVTLPIQSSRSLLMPVPLLTVAIAFAWGVTYAWPAWLFLLIGICGTRTRSLLDGDTRVGHGGPDEAAEVTSSPVVVDRVNVGLGVDRGLPPRGQIRSSLTS